MINPRNLVPIATGSMAHLDLFLVYLPNGNVLIANRSNASLPTLIEPEQVPSLIARLGGRT